MRRSNSRCWMAVLLVAWGCTTACAGQKGDAPPSAKQIAEWARQLDDDAFSVREAASRNLLKAGQAAIEPVAAAAAGSSLEVTTRSIDILAELASAGATARPAKEALSKLATSEHPATAVRASKALRAYQQRIAATLARSGAQVQTRDGQFVAVNFDAATELGENLRLLHELPDVEEVSLSNPLMDDAGLAELAGLPRLRELNLFNSRVSDAGLKHLKTLPSLRRVPMGMTQVTDRGLVHLKDLTQLEYVGLRGNQVTDAGLVHLKNLTNLTGLYLGETKVTDAGLVHLRPLAKLNMLLLDQTKVGDAGLEHLNGLEELRDLDLSDTQVTAAGVAGLKKALPQVEIRLKQP